MNFDTDVLFEDWKFKISRLYQDWDELTAELGDRIGEIDEHRVLTLVDCDDTNTCILSAGFHCVNRAGYYIIDPPWRDEDLDDCGGISDEQIEHYTGLDASALLAQEDHCEHGRNRIMGCMSEDEVPQKQMPVRLGQEPHSDAEALKEVLWCVPGERAKKLIESYMRGETARERLVSRPELLRRGWRESMFKKFLPEPVAMRFATAYWLLSCIEAIEATNAWKAARARAAARRARVEKSA